MVKNLSPLTLTPLIDFTLSNARRFYSSLYLNPFTLKSDLIDFTLSNARRFYSISLNPLTPKSHKGDPKERPVGSEKTISLNPLTPKLKFYSVYLP